ncbi:proton-coupled amino acid transporter 1-like isoform X2 [Symsagittifera roscoffensis]|uniref:proton-coupled amino acid transporter 1-like isoform X2 n=1 Tax=Symsagittifera roscoffensis TaxID=84072 RepID=UPI00307BE96B
MGEHSNAEDDSYSMDENKVMLKPHDESDMVSEAEEQLLQQAETKPKKQPGSFRKRVDSASSRIRQGSFVSLIGEERTGDNLITAPQCLMHLLKGMIGSGLLALPHAFSLVGIVAGPIYMAVICVIALVAMNFLVDANRHLCKVERVSHMDYGDLAECAIRHGPIQRLRRHSHWGKAIVNFLLILTQLGFCAIYFVFFAETVQSIMDDYDAHKHIDVHILITCFLLPVVLICLIRNLALLAVFSLLANVLLFGGLAVIVYELFDDIPSPSELPAFESITNIPLFFGTAIYCVEGIGLVLPLENKMRKPEQFKPVFNAGMVFVFLLYLLFGFLGYNKFHEDIQGSISYNLPKEWYFAATKVVFAIAMYVTYALQFVVPVRILMPWVNTKFPYGSEDIREYLFRLVLIMFTFIAAIAIPYLDKVINLLGSVASSSLALSLPAIIMELSLHTNTSISKTRKFVYRVLVVILVVVGVTGGIVGTVMSFEDIIKAFTAADSTHLINPTTIAPNTTMNLADYILNVGSQE